MADTPEFQKGPAEVGQTGDQLPQGEATDLNQGMQQANDAANPAQPMEPGPTGAEPLTPSAPAPYTKNDTNNLLLGPSTRPGEAVTTGMGVNGRPKPPPDAVHWATSLASLAQDPTAPPAIRAIYSAIVDAAANGGQ